MANAWMIRNDRKRIPVNVHPYGSPDDVEDTLLAAEWLYSNTADSRTRALVVDLIVAYARKEFDGIRNEQIPTVLPKYFADLGYPVLSTPFIKSLADQIVAANPSASLSDLNALVNAELNQQFLRARYGGMYDTSRGSRGMYFRVSSTGFNWFDIIWSFVYDHRDEIDTVTIVRDEESTGQSNYYYRLGSDVVDQMPVDDFINAKGRPTIDSLPSFSVLSRYPRMNTERLLRLYARDTIRETKQYYECIRK